MSRNISPSKKQSKDNATAKTSQFAIELTRKEVFLWLGLAFLAMVWMFTLGVIVGRGLSPVRFDVEELTQELIALKSREETNKPSFDKLSNERQLGFYDILTDKKEEARLESTPMAPKTSSKLTARDDISKSFTLQVAALKDVKKAEEMVSKLNRKGYGAYAIKAHITGRGTYHRVRVGHFKDRHDAQQMAAMLRHEKLEPIVITE